MTCDDRVLGTRRDANPKYMDPVERLLHRSVTVSPGHRLTIRYWALTGPCRVIAGGRLIGDYTTISLAIRFTRTVKAPSLTVHDRTVLSRNPATAKGSV